MRKNRPEGGETGPTTRRIPPSPRATKSPKNKTQWVHIRATTTLFCQGKEFETELRSATNVELKKWQESFASTTGSWDDSCRGGTTPI